MVVNIVLNDLKYLQNSTNKYLLAAMVSSKLATVRTRTSSSSTGFSAFITEKMHSELIKRNDKNFIFLLISKLGI